MYLLFYRPLLLILGWRLVCLPVAGTEYFLQVFAMEKYTFFVIVPQPKWPIVEFKNNCKNIPPWAHVDLDWVSVSLDEVHTRSEQLHCIIASGHIWWRQGMPVFPFIIFIPLGPSEMGLGESRETQLQLSLALI